MYLKVLCIVFVSAVLQTSDAGKICKVPNGNAGTCVQISKCKPLWDLFQQKRLSSNEHLYLRQAFCGDNQSSRIKMCCPDKSEWSNFTATPVEYPKPGNEYPTLNPTIDLFTATEGLKPECGTYHKILGADVAAVEQYPWLVLLEYSGESLDCGGSLITTRFVMTAAHCIDFRLPLFARLGQYDLRTGPLDYALVDGAIDHSEIGMASVEMVVVPVEMGVSHPNFSRTLFYHDIGLIKLARNAPITDFIRTICLPSKNYIPQLDSNTRFIVAKWGENVRDKTLNNVKKELYLPYVPLKECVKYQSKTLFDTQICAGGEEGYDTCRGDSGGPLMYETDGKYIAVGLISFGSKICGTKGQPGVYTHVYKYIDWINSVVNV